MALSGTLETFSLPDVLRLLSSTKKTGLLALQGDRGDGSVWVHDGELVAAEADRAVFADLEGALFELLRFVDATFEFQAGVEPADRDEARSVDTALEAAEARLAEWREIESVVPSLDVWVRMVPELDGPLTVAPEQWRVLASVGTGLDGHGLARHLEQGEFDVCRQLRDLVHAGMVQLDERPAEVPTSPVAEGVLTVVEPVLSSHEVSSLGADLASFVAVGTVDEPVDEPSAFEAMVDTGDVAEAEAEAEWPEITVPPTTDIDTSDATDVDTTDDPDDIDDIDDIDDLDDAEVTALVAEETDESAEVAEVAEDAGEDLFAQLSHLSPKAAAAIEAVAGPDSGEGADVAHEALDEAPEAAGTDAAGAAGDQRPGDIDQNLLLRFLSSAKH